MKRKRLLFGLAILAGMLCLTTTKLPGQDVADTDPGWSPPSSAEIATDAGAVFNLKARNERLQKVGLRPGQLVKVTLTFSTAMSGQTVAATALDGGTITLPARGIIAKDGSLSLHFKAGNDIGLYRVLVNQGDNGQMLEFWVRDLTNSDNNPVLFPGS
ncbi:MAG TPA: hypothetical protein VJ719_14060 [Chthoniobacterales bacterium]|nr:hypothetical protein [Chthoniobacterales bacterium]